MCLLCLQIIHIKLASLATKKRKIAAPLPPINSDKNPCPKQLGSWYLVVSLASMATSIPSCSFHSYMAPSIIPNNSTSTTHFTLSFSHANLSGISLCTRNSSRILAKFEKFEGDDASQDNLEEAMELQEQAQTVQEEDDSCLPSDLEGAVRQSSQASALFVSSGGMRAIVELLIPQLQFLDDEGAQAELWELSRIFLDTLIEETGSQRIKAIFPDAGAAALLKYLWKDAAFGFSSLSDRKPVQIEDDIVVMVVPDYQMLEKVQKIVSDLSDDPPRPLIMWNPRLISEDVGVGINVRNLRRYFLSTFTTVYSMRPLPAGAVFRCYPELWKVFYDDKDRPNRYLLAQESVRRPDAEEIEIIFGNAEEKSEQGPSLFSKAAGIFSSLNRFMRVISK